MLAKENVLELIYDSLEEINASRSSELKIALQPDTRLLGEGGLLDSLDVVELIVKLEEQLTLRLNRHVMLLDEQLLSEENSPLCSVASLAAFLQNNFFDSSQAPNRKNNGA